MGVTALLGMAMRPRRLADAGAPLELQGMFPVRFGSWQEDKVAAAFVRPADELANRLYAQLLERTFVDAQGRRVMLSVAYGREQASGLQLHWPEVCYRYGGFSVHGKHLAAVSVDGKDLPVTRLVAELPLRPEPVTYWSVLGHERIPDANTFRLRQLAYAVRREIPDGLLVRVSSIDPLAERAYALQAAFIDELLRAMAPPDRLRVIGTPPQG
jgi:EpsI family protein